MRACAIGLILALAAGGAAAAATPWAPVAWLEGDWKAIGAGEPGQSSGDFTFHPEAGGQVLVRRSFAAYPAQDGRRAQRHDDFTVIYAEGGALRAVYWDSEGHEIHYAVSAPSPDQALFVSDDPAGPRYRLTYTRTAKGLDGRFEIAPPNARDQFKAYLTWSARKTAP